MKMMKIEGFYHVPIVVSVMKNVHGGVRIAGEPIWQENLLFFPEIQIGMYDI